MSYTINSKILKVDDLFNIGAKCLRFLTSVAIDLKIEKSVVETIKAVFLQNSPKHRKKLMRIECLDFFICPGKSVAGFF